MKLKTQFRAFRAEDLKVGEDNTVEFPFSSELPVDRYYGQEILSHDASAPDMGRIKGGAAPLLWNHNSDEPIGMIETGELRDKKLFARAKFFSTPFAQEKKKQMQEGLKNVSFGYRIQEMRLMNPKSDSEPEYLATKWTPFEVSIVSVPADPTVGIGRADSDDEIEVRVLNNQPYVGEKNMPTHEKDVQAASAADVTKVREEGAAAGAAAERARITEISALCEKYGLGDLGRELISGDKSIDEARAAVLEKMGRKQVAIHDEKGADVGLSDKEIAKFSFMRAIRAQAEPANRRYQEEAKFEREVSDAAAKKAGVSPKGVLVPFEVLRHVSKRDLTAGSNSGGGYTVATDLMAGSFIEMLRNKSVLQRAGVRTLNGLQGNIDIPKQATGATAYWVAENSAATESALSFGQVVMSPKTVGGFTDISRRLMIQSSIDVENLVKGDLAKALALAIDAKGLYGDGTSNTITGLRYATSLNTVDFTGSDPTNAEIVDMETQIAADNADAGSMKYLVNAQGRGKLKTTLITATYGDRMIWGADNLVNGYPVEVSNQVSKLSTADYDYWFGNFDDALMGFWSGLDLIVDPYTGSTAGTLRIVALQDVDFAVRHGESFCYGNKTIT